MAHIEVELTFLPTEHGGRKTPARTGYRPQFYYAGEDWDAEHEYVGAGELKPGETAKALVTFFSPQYHAGRVFVGMPFLIREGNRVVGFGRVTQIMALGEFPGSEGGRSGAE